MLFREQALTMVIPLIMTAGLYCGYVLWQDPKFKRKRLGKIKDLRKHSSHLHRSFTVWSLFIVVLAWWLLPKLFLSLPAEQPLVWLSTLLIYPLLSVIPQELIFRTFFFHRFKKIFRSKMLRIVISTLCFALAHCFYGNWIAVAVSAAGGLLFGLTYVATRSTLVVVVQHSAWGLLLMTVGIGNYFNTDMIG